MTQKKPDLVDIEIGSRIRRRRKELSLTQNALAESLGISFQQIQKYERGANRVGAGRLQHIADLLAVPVSFFFGGTSTASMPKGDLSVDDDEAIALVTAFSKIEDKGLRGKVLAFVQSLRTSDGPFDQEA